MRLRSIAQGAYLHDIGKIAIPAEILLKPDKLTDEEMAIVGEHISGAESVLVAPCGVMTLRKKS